VERGRSLLPPLRRKSAPEGERPVLSYFRKEKVGGQRLLPRVRKRGRYLRGYRAESAGKGALISSPEGGKAVYPFLSEKRGILSQELNWSIFYLRNRRIPRRARWRRARPASAKRRT